MTNKAFAYVAPDNVDLARRLCGQYASFATELTEGEIGATKVVDAYGAFAPHADTLSWWQGVADETLTADDFTGEATAEDVTALYAAITVAIGEWADWDSAAEANGFVRTPPEPTDDDIRAYRDERILAGSTFTVTGYADPIPISGDLQTQVVFLSLKGTAKELQEAGVTAAVLPITDVNDKRHMLTAAQTLDLVSAGQVWVQRQYTIAKDMADGVGDFPDGKPFNYQDESYWT